MTTLIASQDLAARWFDSPFGSLTIVGSRSGLRAILWPDDDPARAGLAGIRLEAGSLDVLNGTTQQLDEYFAGTRSDFDLPLDLHGTPFQLVAWKTLAEIPYGETRTYAEQAARIGRPSAVRAIGTASGRNPVSIVLPCHRVVGSDGSLRGFAGGLDVKAALLSFEAGHAVPWAGPVALGGEAAVP
jgi:methylated-DNA-[protein]-cysteine S-methyltransferase